MHAPYNLSAYFLDDFSGIYRKPSILAADDFLGACYRKAMTPKMLCTLLFPHFGKNDVRIAEKQMLQRNFCNATSENCSTTSVFACGVLQGWGLTLVKGWGLGIADPVWKPPGLP